MKSYGNSWKSLGRPWNPEEMHLMNVEIQKTHEQINGELQWGVDGNPHAIHGNL